MRFFRTTAGKMIVGTKLLAISLLLVTAHVASLREMRDAAIPLGASLAPLEDRLDMLQKQIELSQLQAQLRTGSNEEKLATYILPKESDLQRVLSFVDVSGLLLQQSGMLRGMSTIEVGEPVALEHLPEEAGRLTARTLSFGATFSDDGLDRFLMLINLSGLLTIGDALTPPEIEKLFALTEAENYAGIVPVEKFLGTDLLAYLQEPKSYEDEVFRALSSENFLEQFRYLLQASRIGKARETINDAWWPVFERQKLWPTQFLSVDTLETQEVREGWKEVRVVLRAYGREK